MNDKDRRFQRTKRNIKTAFMELLRRESFEKISINQISESADINRSTFYLHYADKYALLDEIICEKLDFLIENSKSLKGVADTDRLGQILSKILEGFWEERDFLRIMFRPENCPFFSVTFKSYMVNIIQLGTSDEIDMDTKAGKFYVQLRASALAGIIEWWITDEEPMDVQNLEENILNTFKNMELIRFKQ